MFDDDEYPSARQLIECPALSIVLTLNHFTACALHMVLAEHPEFIDGSRSETAGSPEASEVLRLLGELADATEAYRRALT